MPRRVQDIIPGNHRSVRDIQTKKTSKGDISRTTETPIKIHREHISEPEVHEKKPASIKKRTKRSGFPWIIGILGFVVILAGLAFGISGHFASATFILVPKVSTINVNGTYIIPSSSNGAFGYEIESLSGIASTTLPAVQGAYTETKAQGSITVYNSYSMQPQRIVAGSRISNASGLVYRLTSTIVVPGYTKPGSSIIPGSIVTSILAENAGEQYNISSSDTISDFNFVAYKGTPKYTGFYARLVSNVSGGFAGTRIVVAPALLASTTVQIQKNLSAELRAKLMSTVPTGYVMYSSIYGSTFNQPSVTARDAQTAQISAGVTVYGILFKKTELAHFLSNASSTNLFGSFGYTTPNIEALSVTLANPKDFSPITKTNLVTHISGTFDMVGTIPVNTLKQAFAGVSLSQTAIILNKYNPVIDIPKSSAEITPPWVGTVPSDQNRINISVKQP